MKIHEALELWRHGSFTSMLWWASPCAGFAWWWWWLGQSQRFYNQLLTEELTDSRANLWMARLGIKTIETVTWSGQRYYQAYKKYFWTHSISFATPLIHFCDSRYSEICQTLVLTISVWICLLLKSGMFNSYENELVKMKIVHHQIMVV